MFRHYTGVFITSLSNTHDTDTASLTAIMKIRNFEKYMRWKNYVYNFPFFWAMFQMWGWTTSNRDQFQTLSSGSLFLLCQLHWWIELSLFTLLPVFHMFEIVKSFISILNNFVDWHQNAAALWNINVLLKFLG